MTLSSSTITFGPPGREWQYTPHTRTYDLSNSSPKKITIQTSEGPKDTHFSIDPNATALVVVDMQNFFLDPKCIDHPNGLKAVEPTIAVLQKCHELGIKVAWLNWGLTDAEMATMPASVQRAFMRDTLQGTNSTRYGGLGSDLGDGKGRCLFAGSWNADIYPALKDHVKPGDLHCAKNRMSGMWTSEQPLWKALNENGKKTLLFTGVNTDQCVLGTFVDAYNAGWDCVLIDDCCGTTTSGGREVSVHNVASAYGFVTDSSRIVNPKVG